MSAAAWVVYALLHPVTRVTFYIGQTATQKRRKYEHERHARMVGGVEPIFSVLEEFESLDEALLGEKNWIECGFASGWPLTNQRPVGPKRPPRFAFCVTPKMVARVQRVLAAELAERPCITLSDVLREALDAGLRTKESPGTNDDRGDGGR